MTTTLVSLQVLCALLFVASFVLARISGHQAWLWVMALAAVGLVVCTGLAIWGPVLGLGWPN